MCQLRKKQTKRDVDLAPPIYPVDRLRVKWSASKTIDFQLRGRGCGYKPADDSRTLEISKIEFRKLIRRACVRTRKLPGPRGKRSRREKSPVKYAAPEVEDNAELLLLLLLGEEEFMNSFVRMPNSPQVVDFGRIELANSSFSFWWIFCTKVLRFFLEHQRARSSLITSWPRGN